MTEDLEDYPKLYNQDDLNISWKQDQNGKVTEKNGKLMTVFLIERILCCNGRIHWSLENDRFVEKLF